MKIVQFIILLICFTALSISTTFAQTPEREEIPERYQWNLGDIYPSNQAFHEALKSAESQIPKLKSYEGNLGKNADILYKALRLYTDLRKDQVRMVVFSFRQADQDLRIGANQSLKQEAQSLGRMVSEASAYLEPEIITIDSKKIEEFISTNPKLNEFAFYLKDIQRMKAHTLSPAEEKLLASSSMMSTTPVDIYNIFTNAEMISPVVILSDGSEVEVDASSYVRYRASQNRADREKVMAEYFNNYKNYEGTLGSDLAGKVRGDYFYASSRKYNSVLEYSLDEYKIPVNVYTNLIEQVNKNLPTLHRALKLKKRMIGVDQLNYYDLYVPFVKEVDMSFTVEQGEKVILDALEPMGKKYLETIQKAFNDRWIDFYPAKGKRSGAYSTGGAYDVHPYILHNWIDDYESVSTLAHELGHTMHSYFTNSNQPFINTNYATFIAEIASTLNENLLNDYMIDHAKSDDEKLYLLGSYLEMLRQTIFRQTSFAEFELEIHKKVENNEPLTGEIMSNIYMNIVKKYYGDAEGVCKVNDYIAYEWSYIPHFLNYTYYVYQYSTSLIYSTAFAEKILNEGQPAVDKFYKILKGGSSDYPINLIKEAGLDPLSDEAFNLTMKRMNEVIDQIEEILDKRG